MRACPLCRQALRYDESYATAQTEAGTSHCCQACYAALSGLPAPEPRTYPPGGRIPEVNGIGRHLPVCGLCRRALQEDEPDPPKPLRFYPEDVARLPEDMAWVLPMDCFAACTECHARFRPLVEDRLRAEGLLSATATAGGNLLL